jgi:hypothetical protein
MPGIVAGTRHASVAGDECRSRGKGDGPIFLPPDTEAREPGRAAVDLQDKLLAYCASLTGTSMPNASP